QVPVTLKLMKRSPSAASLSSSGVCATPPKVLVSANPISSKRISTILGAFAGGFRDCGQSATESLTLVEILPLNCGSGDGSTSEANDGSRPAVAKMTITN